MSKPGGTPAPALGQQSFGQSYKSPMQQAAAPAMQPKPGFNGGLAQMGAQMLGGGGNQNVAAMMPQIMQMFHGHKPQQPALGQSGGPNGTYGIGKPQGGAFGQAVQMTGATPAYGQPMTPQGGAFGHAVQMTGATPAYGQPMTPQGGQPGPMAQGFGSRSNINGWGTGNAQTGVQSLGGGLMNISPSMFGSLGSTIQPGAQMPRPNVSSLWMR